ncbi:hypothetical protein TRSC58_07268 [Trypanosoma rangeli SC58]|uniref:Uncharacterized protein n=1 Tax=Trypanosoma rangeli SC58 TaxID=429131 RepID=A0A061IS53_TRYRA|nr:hypothetical protein TRSC58_07268 [Trypanosoma rangeli SC58]
MKSTFWFLKYTQRCVFSRIWPRVSSSSFFLHSCCIIYIFFFCLRVWRAFFLFFFFFYFHLNIFVCLFGICM